MSSPHGPQNRLGRIIKRIGSSSIGISLLFVSGFAMMVPGFIGLSRDRSAASDPVYAAAGQDARPPAKASGFEAARIPSTRGAETRVEPERSLIDWSTRPVLDPDTDNDITTFDCMLLPWEQVEVRSPVIGRIDAIHVERADTIEPGQLLVELDADLARAGLDLAEKRAAMTGSLHSLEARSRLSKVRSERADSLFESRAMPLDKHQEVQTEHEIARFELEEARDRHALASLEFERANAEYAQRRIRSPLRGVVVDRLMSVGEVVDEETVLELAQIDPLRVEVVLPADQFGSIAPGMKATITPETAGGEVRVATVRIVDRLIDSASGTFGAALELPNPDLAIPSGLRCEVRFIGFVEEAGAPAAKVDAPADAPPDEMAAASMPAP